MIFHACSFYRAQGAQDLLLVMENRLISLSKIVDVSKKQNYKKSKSMAATSAGVLYMQRISGAYLLIIPCRY